MSEESDEDSDHIILEWEARRYPDEVGVSQYGSFLEDDHEMTISPSGPIGARSCLGK